jgi:hypothetical protein
VVNIMFKKWLSLIRYLPVVLLLLMGLMLLGMIYFAVQWQNAHTTNQAYLNKTLLAAKPSDDNLQALFNQDQPHLALMHASLLSQQAQTPETIKVSLHALTVAEASSDPNVRAIAKHLSGNLYFDLSAISGNIKAGGSHQQAVAQIALAREAYKGALRLKPNLYESRFNLELIDRLSPEHRTQAWLSETDGVTLQPFKRNGTAMMRDNRRRGLP